MYAELINYKHEKIVTINIENVLIIIILNLKYIDKYDFVKMQK